MDYFFLFTKHLDDVGCLCVKISGEGALITPPSTLNFAEIKSLQEKCRTIIVETAINASLLSLDLPWLPERKARTAIPYALEDKVAQPVEELHFAFDKLRYNNNHYLITVLSKDKIYSLIKQLNKHGIAFDTITLDWFALEAGESWISESILLINHDDFKGSLSDELACTYINNNPLKLPIVFADSELRIDTNIIKENDYSYTWIAQRLIKKQPLNLCQGDIQQGGSTAAWIKKGYQFAGLLCGLWLLSVLLVNAFSLHLINKRIKAIDQKIALIYHEFFPEAKQVISPKFRISQLLGNNTGDSQVHFWSLLNQFAKEINGEEKITIEQLRYQNKTLFITLVSTDFATLEDIANKLRKIPLKVKQTKASNRDQQVIATLELM